MFYSAACTALWYGRRLLYFGDADGSSGQECSGNENSSKEGHWVGHWVGTAPLCARNFLLKQPLLTMLPNRIRKHLGSLSDQALVTFSVTLAMYDVHDRRLLERVSREVHFSQSSVEST